MAQATGQYPTRPCIGVTGNAKRFSPSWHAICLSLRLAGATPVRISVNNRPSTEHLDGLVISGGDDIHPGLYDSEELPEKEYDHDRDKLEQGYIQFALDENLPLMGICRGYQLINVMLGGNLHLDIRKMRRNTSNFGTILPRKTVMLKPASFLAELTGETQLRVNSLHYQAVDRVAEDLRVAGHDLDDFVQVLEHREGAPILGVQWHPEYLFYMPNQLRMFRWLVEQAQSQ